VVVETVRPVASYSLPDRGNFFLGQSGSSSDAPLYVVPG